MSSFTDFPPSAVQSSLAGHIRDYVNRSGLDLVATDAATDIEQRLTDEERTLAAFRSLAPDSFAARLHNALASELAGLINRFREDSSDDDFMYVIRLLVRYFNVRDAGRLAIELVPYLTHGQQNRLVWESIERNYDVYAVLRGLTELVSEHVASMSEDLR